MACCVGDGGSAQCCLIVKPAIATRHWGICYAYRITPGLAKALICRSIERMLSVELFQGSPLDALKEVPERGHSGQIEVPTGRGLTAR
ncbi:MAG: hypothetical protein U0401_21145 [Anaerolineae bacterium]